jgi:hypothetical protein
VYHQKIAPLRGSFKASFIDFCSPETGDYSIYTTLPSIFSSSFSVLTATGGRKVEGGKKVDSPLYLS